MEYPMSGRFCVDQPLFGIGDPNRPLGTANGLLGFGVLTVDAVDQCLLVESLLVQYPDIRKCSNT